MNLKLARSIDLSTKAYLDAMMTHPSAREIIMLDNSIRAAKNCGAWASLDGLFFLVGGADQSTRINAKSPGLYDLTKVNSPRFIQYAGWDANGGAGYLDTGFNPVTANGKFSQNSASLGVGVSAAAQSNPIIGNTGLGNSFITTRTASDTFVGRLSSAGSSNITNTASGFFAVARSVSTTVRLFKGGNQALSAAVPSTSPASSTIGILSDNSGGRYAVGVTATFAFWGGNLTGRQMLEMKKLYDSYAEFYGVATS